MFKNLTSFATVRTSTQAIGFYLAYLFIGFLIGAVLGMCGALLGGETGAQAAALSAKLGLAGVLPYILIINVLIVVKKKLGFGYYVLSIISLFLALLGGAALGLIPAAFMSTRQVFIEKSCD